MTIKRILRGEAVPCVDQLGLTVTPDLSAAYKRSGYGQCTAICGLRGAQQCLNIASHSIELHDYLREALTAIPKQYRDKARRAVDTAVEEIQYVGNSCCTFCIMHCKETRRRLIKHIYRVFPYTHGIFTFLSEMHKGGHSYSQDDFRTDLRAVGISDVGVGRPGVVSERFYAGLVPIEHTRVPPKSILKAKRDDTEWMNTAAGALPVVTEDDAMPLEFMSPPSADMYAY